MFRFNLSDPFGLAMMVAVAIASIGGGVVITILLDAIRERRALRRMGQEFLAFAERIELAFTPCAPPKIGRAKLASDMDWIEDDSAWDDPRERDHDEDFAEWEARSQEESDHFDYLDYVKRRLRRVEDAIDAIERYQIDLLCWHPDCEGRDALPQLAWTAECLLVEEDQLRGELEF
ncbi:MAG: hypothetical protein ACOX2R_00350 [Anaerolineae bacterium]|jgi:hypothetical protein